MDHRIHHCRVTFTDGGSNAGDDEGDDEGDDVEEDCDDNVDTDQRGHGLNSTCHPPRQRRKVNYIKNFTHAEVWGCSVEGQIRGG